MDEVRMQVIFKVDTKHGAYQDALWFSEAEYSELKQEDLDRMKQKRVDNWLKVVTTPVPEISATEKVAQVQSEIDMLTLRLQELQIQKAEMVK